MSEKSLVDKIAGSVPIKVFIRLKPEPFEEISDNDSQISERSTPEKMKPSKSMSSSSMVKKVSRKGSMTSLSSVSVSHKVNITPEGEKTLKVTKTGDYVREPDKKFNFDKIFPDSVTQEEVFSSIEPFLKEAVCGYNMSVISMGAANSGKSYTMNGNKSDEGLIPRAIKGLFKYIDESSLNGCNLYVEMSYVEIYNNSFRNLMKKDDKEQSSDEVVSIMDENDLDDILDSSSQFEPPAAGNQNQINLSDKIEIHESAQLGVFLSGPNTRVHVRNVQEAIKYYEKGQKLRATGQSPHKYLASRSHAIMTFFVEGRTIELVNNNIKSKLTMGRLQLVDLAGTDRIDNNEDMNQNFLMESKNINGSITSLGDVLYNLDKNAILTQKAIKQNNPDLAKKLYHIPYLNSKLSHMLKEALGGNSQTILMTHVNPNSEFSNTETYLKYSTWARHTRCKLEVNEITQKDLDAKENDPEVLKLKKILEERSKQFESSKAKEMGLPQANAREVESAPIKEEKPAPCPKCATLESELDALRKKLEASESAKKDLDQSLSDMKSDNGKLKEALEQKEAALKAQSDREIETQKDHMAEKEKLEALLAKLEANSSSLEAALGELQSEKNAILKEKDQLVNQLNASKENTEDLKSKADEKDRLISDLQDQLKNLQRSLNSGQQEFMEQQEDLQKKVHELEDQLKASQKLSKDALDKLKASKQLAHSLEKDLNDKDKAIQDLTKRLEKTNQTSSKEKAALNDANLKLQNDIETNKNNLSAVEAERDDLQSQLGSLTTQLNEMEKRMAKVKELGGKSMNDLKEKSGQIDQLTKQLAELKAKLSEKDDELKASQDTHQSEVARLNEAIHKAEQDSNDAQRRLQDQVKQIDSLRVELDALKGSLSDLQKILSEKDSQMEALSTENKNLQSNIEDLTRNAGQEKDRLNKEHKAEHSRQADLVKRLQEELDLLKSQIGELSNRESGSDLEAAYKLKLLEYHRELFVIKNKVEMQHNEILKIVSSPRDSDSPEAQPITSTYPIDYMSKSLGNKDPSLSLPSLIELQASISLNKSKLAAILDMNSEFTAVMQTTGELPDFLLDIGAEEGKSMSPSDQLYTTINPKSLDEEGRLIALIQEIASIVDGNDRDISKLSQQKPNESPPLPASETTISGVLSHEQISVHVTNQMIDQPVEQPSSKIVHQKESDDRQPMPVEEVSRPKNKKKKGRN